ncbi:BQ2448_973 [Microbotryum intermedium]|uniref:BQ2448_973 protein n=1 Tax=Microbotryum intermedium TaxID=269621 RepID=A0A238F4B8_9BASI|nr:BQ2448_973 [Microbotryum intermedium]
MMVSLPWIAYPIGREQHNFLDLNKQGNWSPHTASVDCCELNYSKSDWIVEYYITLTRLVICQYSSFETCIGELLIILIHLFGWTAVILGNQTLVGLIQQQLLIRFRLASFGVMELGITSSLYHATLRFEFQLMEEMVFVWLTLLGAWILYRSWTSVLLIARLAQLLLSKTLPDSGGLQYGRRMIRSAAALGGFGLIAPKADRSFCSPSTALKILNLPRIAFLFEGHAWSHFLTALNLQHLKSGVILVTMSVCNDSDHLVRMACGWIEAVERTEKGWKALGEDPSILWRKVTIKDEDAGTEISVKF